jgi:hypothetical protein
MIHIFFSIKVNEFFTISERIYFIFFEKFIIL